MSATGGPGNTEGVAVAVSIGGPRATFWMILAGLLGMASKFTECPRGVKQRTENPDGTVSGGPMSSSRKGLAECGLPFCKPLAALVAVFCVLGAQGGGNMFQANEAASRVPAVFDEILRGAFTDTGLPSAVKPFGTATRMWTLRRDGRSRTRRCAGPGA